MNLDISDALTLFVDPSGFLLVAKKTTEEIVDATTSSFSDWLSPASAKGNVNSGATGKTCCSRYALESEFLLDTQSGKVWRYDSGSNSFKEVSKEKSEIQKRAEGLFWTQVATGLLDLKAKQAAKMHYSERPVLERSMDELIAAIGKHVTSL